MNVKKFFWAVSMFLLVSGVFLGAGIVRTASLVRIAFLDVGQGDAILITRGSNQLLIDTGKDGRSLLSELGKVLPPWDRRVETVILTHPDQDHIGALPDLLSKYRVSTLLSEDISSDTEIGRVVRDAIDRRGIPRILPRAGLSIAMSPDARAEVLFPDRDYRVSQKNTNAGSVVVRLRVGIETFLFTGDLPREEVVLPAEDIRVLKVSHHGSKYSTSDVFLNRMTPEEAVISVGKNSYGHPAEEVLTRLEARGIRVFRTDRDGTVIYDCFPDSNRPCSIL